MTRPKHSKRRPVYDACVKWTVILWVALSGCVASDSVTCSDGRLCPDGTACDQTHTLCVLPDQLTACNGKTEGMACTADMITGVCTGGVCLPMVCGDGIVEAGEACDDGNNADNDGCSADCLSDETCGNGVIDAVKGEQCDDGNHLQHDGCSSNCLIETPEWIQHSVAPPARSSPAVAYDSQRDRTVMFGGDNLAGVNLLFLNDTWEWNGGEWLEVPTTIAPLGRTLSGMAYDAAHGTTVMYGGSGGLVAFSDTWLWDGSTWRSVDVAGPGPRGGMTMAYDAKRARVVLFGGNTLDLNTPMMLADTYEWDGSTWTKITTAHSPPARQQAAMTYDPHHGVIVLTGGTDSANVFADTWQYDGTDWTNVTPVGTVPVVEAAAMAYDTTGQRVILFGGVHSGTAQATTWAWSGTAWTSLAGTAPAARDNFILAQGGGGRLVAFGGDAAGTLVAAQTWVFANGWTQVVDPGPLDSFSVANDPVHLGVVVLGGVSSRNPSVVRSPSTWVLSQSGFGVRAGAPPAARSNACMTYDYAHDNIVLFGGNTGANNGIANNDTWTWDGVGWTQHFPAQSPSVRGAAVCAFDGHGVTVFGGQDSAGDGPMNDAWTWDGANWTPAVTPPTALTPRINATAAYDPLRKQMVLFGGINGNLNELFGDTWAYDGTTWTQEHPAFQPSARYSATLTWNDARHALVLIGGSALVNEIDSYEWDGSAWHDATAPNPPLARLQHGAMTALDGGGVIVYGGTNLQQGLGLVPYADRWELRWDAPHPSERCNSADLDGDHAIACADPDCWRVCAPLCPPGTTCDPSAPTCGDGICDATREDCRTCAADCTCAPVCGDFICDPGETNCPGDCP